VPYTLCKWKSLTLDDLEDHYALLQLYGARWSLSCYISNRKLRIGSQIICKLLTLDDL